MLAPTAPRLARQSRLLPAAATPLVLAIRGGEHDGRVIRIRSAKCTVGSATGCTLRLRSPGVKPLHCWILRGPGGTVIRRCAGDAQLNGAGFTDAPLVPGYRLRIGPVELEVLGCPVAPAAAFIAPAVPECDHEIESLELASQESKYEVIRLREKLADVETRAAQQLRELNELIARVSAERDALQEQARQFSQQVVGEREALAAQAEHLRRQIDELTAEQAAVELRFNERAGQVASEIEARDREVAAIQQELDKVLGERDGHVEQCLSLSRQVTALEGELREKAEELNGLRNERAAVGQQSAQMTMTMDELRHTSEDEQARLQQSHAELAAETQTLRASLGDLTNQLREAQTAQQLLDENHQQVDELQAELQARQARIEQLQQQVALAQEELAAAQQASPALQNNEDGRCAATIVGHVPADAALVESLRQQVCDLQATLDAQRQTLAAQQEQVASEREQLLAAQSEAVARREQLERAQAELAAEQGQAEENVRAKEQLLNHQAEELSDRLERAAARQAELDRREQELRDLESLILAERTEVEQRQAELESQQAALSHQPTPVETGCEQPIEQLVEESPECLSEEPAVEVPADEPAAKPSDSQNVESVLSRLVQAGLWRGGEAEETAAEPVAEQPTAIETSAEPEPVAEEEADAVASEVAAPKPWTQTPQATPAEGDESIESYMDRLLKRVRGESGGNSPYKPAPVTPAASKVAVPLPEIKPVEVAVETVRPEEYIPRSPAPEQGANLAAMRELANSAARSAIETHAKNRGGKLAVGKFSGAGIAVILGLVLVVFAISQGSWLVALGALVGLGFSGFWAFQGARHALFAMKLDKPAARESVPVNPTTESPAAEENRS